MGRWLLPFVWQAVVTVILIWNRKVLLRRTITFSFWVQTLIQTTECKQVRARNIQSQLCDSQLVNNRNASTYNSFFLKKTNYLRLKNAQLGYTFSKDPHTSYDSRRLIPGTANSNRNLYIRR